MKRFVLASVLLIIAVYGCDYLSLRFRREPFGVVQVQRYYEVSLKNRKTEYMRDEPRPQPCVHSMFPHHGDTPCWYLERHTRQTIKIGSNPSDFWKLP